MPKWLLNVFSTLLKLDIPGIGRWTCVCVCVCTRWGMGGGQVEVSCVCCAYLVVAGCHAALGELSLFLVRCMCVLVIMCSECVKLMLHIVQIQLKCGLLSLFQASVFFFSRGLSFVLEERDPFKN